MGTTLLSQNGRWEPLIELILKSFGRKISSVKIRVFIGKD
jgi:hypothetical protein